MKKQTAEGEKGKIMGKTIYDWWGYTLRILDKYPRLDAAAKRGAMLNARERRELAAVRRLLDELEGTELGHLKAEMLRLRHFKHTHDLEGVALKLHYSRRIIAAWHSETVRRLGVLMGLED